MAKTAGLGEGVYFAEAAYAGLGRRFAIQVIDLVVLLLGAALLMAFVFEVLGWDADYDVGSYFLLCVGWIWSYLVLIETLWGTVGFRLTGVRIVNHQGVRPSLWRMTFRMGLLILGPIHPLIDLVWVGGDSHRQTIRDKFCGTYVIRKNAAPLGRGSIRAQYYSLLGMTIPFAEIQHIAESDSNERSSTSTEAV